MSLNKTHISNERVVGAYKRGGVSAVLELYSRGSDVVFTELGIATDISNMHHDVEWSTWDPVKKDDIIREHIRKHLGIHELKK